jgi:hypothetical protein
VLDGKPSGFEVNVGCSTNIELLGSGLPLTVLLVDTVPYRRWLGVVDEAQTLIALANSLL